MTRRVLLGKRGTQFGMWVSQAGSDVATSPNLLFNMLNAVQILYQASYDFTGGTKVPGFNQWDQAYTHPNFGSTPPTMWLNIPPNLAVKEIRARTATSFTIRTLNPADFTFSIALLSVPA